VGSNVSNDWRRLKSERVSVYWLGGWVSVHSVRGRDEFVMASRAGGSLLCCVAVALLSLATCIGVCLGRIDELYEMDHFTHLIASIFKSCACLCKTRHEKANR